MPTRHLIAYCIIALMVFAASLTAFVFVRRKRADEIRRHERPRPDRRRRTKRD